MLVTFLSLSSTSKLTPRLNEMQDIKENKGKRDEHRWRLKTLSCDGGRMQMSVVLWFPVCSLFDPKGRYSLTPRGQITSAVRLFVCL